MKRGSEPEKEPAADNIIVGSERAPVAQKLLLVAGCSIIVVALAGVAFWLIKKHDDNAKADNNQSQKVLVKELKVAESQANNQSIIGLSTELIDGAKRYKLNNDDLGWYYVDRANAYLSTKRYKQAAPDFDKAANLNNSLKMAAFQGEFEARYSAGERDQLIPLLQQILQLEGKSRDPMHGSEVARYTEYLDDIRQGKEIML